MAFLDNNAGTLRARFYFSLRSYLHKKRWLLRLVQVLRASIVLGPFRKPIVRYYQKFGHNDPLKTDIHPLFPDSLPYTSPTHFENKHLRG